VKDADAENEENVGKRVISLVTLRAEAYGTGTGTEESDGTKQTTNIKRYRRHGHVGQIKK
jgi:hypothetical protein